MKGSASPRRPRPPPKGGETRSAFACLPQARPCVKGRPSGDTAAEGKALGGGRAPKVAGSSKQKPRRKLRRGGHYSETLTLKTPIFSSIFTLGTCLFSKGTLRKKSP
jgi:hypothetical protein